MSRTNISMKDFLIPFDDSNVRTFITNNEGIKIEARKINFVVWQDIGNTNNFYAECSQCNQLIGQFVEYNNYFFLNNKFVCSQCEFKNGIEKGLRASDVPICEYCTKNHTNFIRLGFYQCDLCYFNLIDIANANYIHQLKRATIEIETGNLPFGVRNVSWLENTRSIQCKYNDLYLRYKRFNVMNGKSAGSIEEFDQIFFRKTKEEDLQLSSSSAPHLPYDRRVELSSLNDKQLACFWRTIHNTDGLCWGLNHDFCTKHFLWSSPSPASTDFVYWSVGFTTNSSNMMRLFVSKTAPITFDNALYFEIYWTRGKKIVINNVPWKTIDDFIRNNKHLVMK